MPRTALVTGGASGLGAASAARLRAEGLTVTTLDVSGPADVTADVTDASGLAAMAKDTAGDWAVFGWRAAAVQVKDTARDMASAAADKVGEVGQDLAALIRRHPLQALLAGFGVGIAVGFLAAHMLRK